MANRPNLQAVPDAALAERPKLIVVEGRGGTGKSTTIRIITERAQERGGEITIADANRRNPTLPLFFNGVVRPEFPDDRTVLYWFEALINEQAKARATVVLDVPGGDEVFRSFAGEVALAELLEGEGILPVSISLIGADPDDLAHMSGEFSPAQKVLVLNEGAIRDGRPAAAAFKPIREHKLYREAVARGAREVTLPRLGCMAEINRDRLLFGKAAAAPEIGLVNRQRVTMWRRAVEQALTPIADWLP